MHTNPDQLLNSTQEPKATLTMKQNSVLLISEHKTSPLAQEEYKMDTKDRRFHGDQGTVLLLGIPREPRRVNFRYRFISIAVVVVLLLLVWAISGSPILVGMFNMEKASALLAAVTPLVKGATFSPILPPSYPLAVRNPYLSGES